MELRSEVVEDRVEEDLAAARVVVDSAAADASVEDAVFPAADVAGAEDSAAMPTHLEMRAAIAAASTTAIWR